MSDSDTKTFNLGAVLSLTQEALAAPFSEVHELVEFLARMPVWTHEFPRVLPVIERGVVEQFPAVAGLSPTPDQCNRGEAGMTEWVAHVAAETGLPLQVEVRPLAVDLDTARQEAWSVIQDRVIVVEVPR